MTEMQTIVTVNIGRNLLGDSMGESLWSEFQQMVEMLMAETVGKVSFNLSGNCLSHWQGESEESASFSTVDADISERALDVLRTGLAKLAETYGQDAIAVTVGTSQLITKHYRPGSRYWDHVEAESNSRFSN